MEKSMLLAMVEEAVDRGIAIRQPTPRGIMLVFPSEIRKDLPRFPGDRTLAVSFVFDGPVSGVFAALTVSLIHSVPFCKKDLFKDAALFSSVRGGECGYAVEYPDKSNDAHGKLIIFFDGQADKACRLLFFRYVNTQLEKARQTRLTTYEHRQPLLLSGPTGWENGKNRSIIPSLTGQ